MVQLKMCFIFIANLTAGIEEMDTWTKKGQIKIKKPSAILEYHQMKSGVDKANQLEVQYQLSHGDMKWWKKLFMYFLDNCIN